jgi:hypothetical protein
MANILPEKSKTNLSADAARAGRRYPCFQRPA